MRSYSTGQALVLQFGGQRYLFANLQTMHDYLVDELLPNNPREELATGFMVTQSHDDPQVLNVSEAWAYEDEDGNEGEMEIGYELRYEWQPTLGIIVEARHW